MPQTLAQSFNVANRNVFRNNNAAFSTVRNTFTPGAVRAGGPGSTPTNLATIFNGDLYTICNNAGANVEVRRLDPSTGNWVVVYTSSFTLATAGEYSGLYKGLDGSGDLVMFFVCRRSGTLAISAVRTVDGSAFVEVAAGPNMGGVNTGGFFDGIMFRNQLAIADAVALYLYNPSTDAYTRQVIGNAATSAPYATAFARAQGRLFAARGPRVTNGANEFLNIYELNGAFALLVDGSLTTPTLPQADGSGAPFDQSQCVAMHYDPNGGTSVGALILHTYQDRGVADRGWRIFEIDIATLAVTEITSTLLSGLPALAYPNGADVTGTSGDVHFVVFVDDETNPVSQSTDIWLLVNNGAWVRYTYNGTSTPLTAGGSGGNRGTALSHSQIGGGDLIYEGSSTANPALFVEESGAAVALLGATRRFFRAFTFDETGGAPADAVEDVELRWNRVAEQGPYSQGTLNAVGVSSGPAPAPTLVANRATNVTFDGSSVFFVEWAAVTDGLLDQQFVQTMFRAVL